MERRTSGGVEWGQTVADAIWAWRATDGFSPAPAPLVRYSGRIAAECDADGGGLYRRNRPLSHKTQGGTEKDRKL
jgi:hypothetical protein